MPTAENGAKGRRSALGADSGLNPGSGPYLIRTAGNVSSFCASVLLVYKMGTMIMQSSWVHLRMEMSQYI